MIRDRETLDALLGTIRRFVRETLIPAEAGVAESDHIPAALVEQMRGLGLFGMTIPEEYGGLGLTMEEEVLAAFELGQASPCFRSLVGTNNGIGSLGLVLEGTEEQRQSWLPRMASGEIIASFALTEPDAGSDAASLRSTARRDGGEWVLNGTKRYITNAPEAGLFTVFARSAPAAKGADGISAFLVEAGLPGLVLGKPDRKMGQRGAHVCDVVLNDVRVGAGALLGREGQGFRTAMRTLDRGRIHISAVCVALAERLTEEALSYARERRQFGQPIAGFQLIQAMLADSRTEAYAARCMVMETARARDAGEDVSERAACCKLFASEMVGRVADRAVQIHGGAGYMQEYPVERLYRDARLYRIYEGTSQIQQIVIARAMLRAAERPAER
jgi:acyl-CoA dehydrogenase